MYNTSYQINVERQDIVLRFRRDAINEAALARFLDYLELESLRKQSQLTEKQAADLAKEIDKAVWASLKDSFLKG
jgi:hypothetical protein